MKKNQSTWPVLLSFVLALVVMAGLAVTSFAVTDGGAGNESAPVVDSVDELTAVLNGTQDPETGVNYDVDGNGIVEWDDLAVLKGETLPDLLPNGKIDMISLPLDPAVTLDDELAALQRLYVRGDSTVAIKYDSANRNELLDWLDPVDFSGSAALTFDMFWPNEVGSLSVTLLCGENYDIEHTIAVKSTQAGWSVGVAELADIPAEDLEMVWSVWFARTVEGQTQTVYIDNMQLVEANVTYVAGANGVTGLFGKYVIAGRPYGTLPTPARPFYTFAGWYADAEYKNAVTADTIVAAGDSYTLYAKWEKDETVDTSMTEGGSNANLSVVPDKEDTYLYSVETPSKYEDRYLNIDISDATASVISIDFTFRSANRATIVGGTIEDGKLVNGEVSIGEAVTPALYITDRQDSNGVFGAYYVVVNKETGEPAATLELDTEYTVYITLKAGYHKSVKIAPMGNVNVGQYTDSTNPENVKTLPYVPYVYSMEVSAPVEHHDAPSMGVYMVPSSGNHAMMSLYKKADNGEWLYGYIADNALPKLAYADVADRDLDDNTSYYRRIHVYTGAATTEVRFDFCYHTARNGDDTLVAFGLNNGGTVTIQNVDGTALEGTPAVGQWYTAIINKGDASLGNQFDVYTLGNDIDGTDTNYVQVELCIKNLRAKQAITADDGSVTLNGGLYNANDRDNAITILHEDVRPFAVSISKAGAKQMRVKFMLEDAANFSIDYVDGDAIDYNNPNVIIVDEDGNALKADKVAAGKWYTAIIYAEIERYTNSNGTFWSSGEMCKTGTLTINTAGDLQIKELEAFDGQFGFRLAGIAIEMTKKDMSAYGYKYGYSINVNESSKYDTRIEFLNQRGLYGQLTYDFCITEFNGNSTVGADAELWFEGADITVYDPSGNALASHKDMVVGTWYTIKANIVDMPTGEYGGAIYSFGESADTRKPYKAYIANVNWTPAQVMFDHDYTIKTATLKMNGEDGTFQVDRVTKYDGRATYEVVADSDLWSDRALNLSLLDSKKDFIQVDFYYSVSRNADGKHVAPSMDVYTNLAGTPAAAQYVIVDENDNPVTTLETGNWYRLFISVNGASEFAIVPRTDGWLRVQFKELETYSADELNVTITSDDPMNVSTANVLDRFGNMQYGIANYAGNTGVVTIRPNASTYKQVRFNFILKELGTPVMSIAGAKIAILDTNGNPVNVADLTVGTQYVAKITNSGEALPTAIKLTVGSGNTRMIIQNLAAYDTTDDPAADTQHSVFHGLEDGEMMIAGFLGPRESYTNVHGVAKPPMIRDDVFALLAASGINYIDDNSFSYSGTQLEVAKDVLRLASKYNLNYFIGATDIANIGQVTSSTIVNGNTVNTYYSYVAPYATFAAKLDEMSQYKAFGGLHLRDEPGADLFDEIGTALKHIADYNAANGTKLEGFVNLLPGVGAHRLTNGQTISGLGYQIDSWPNYVRAYADIAKPAYLSFDMYPIQGSAGQIEYAYFNFLGYFATVAKEKGLPMAVCIQVGGGEPSLPAKRQATTDEMHWNVNTSLAFGAEAMTYFIMVEPPYYGSVVNNDTKNTHTAINVDGQPTPYYDAIKAINTNVKAIDHVIVNGTHKGVIFNGTMPNTVASGTTTEIQAPYDGTQLNKSAAKLSGISGNALIGVYEYEGKTALYVVNNSITSANTIGLTFNSNYTYEIISEGKTSWSIGSSLSLNLAIGRAAMIIVHTEAVSTDVLVSFELNYETTTPNPAGKFITTGQVYGELPTPVRPFYTFDGWYTNAEFTGAKVEASTVMNEMNDHALFAKWVEADLVITQNNANHASLTVGDEQGTYIYTSNVAGTTSPDSRSLQLKLNVTGKEIVKFNFKFTTSLAADGSALTPDMHVADVNNGYWRGANWVATDENGEPVANFVTGKWYTMWITTEGQSSFRIYPMGQNAGQQVNVEMQIKNLEAVDAELPTNYVGNNPGDGSTFNHIGFYQSASGDWEMFHSAYNRYSEFLYGGVGQNTSYNRRVQLHLDSADYTTATFKFKYNVAQHKAAATEEDPNPVFAPNLNLASSINVTVLDANGNTVAVADRQLGVWYTAVLKKSDGSAIGTSATVYAAYGSEGKEGAYTEVEMLIKDVKAYKSVAHPAYTNADSSVSIQSNGIQNILTKDGNNIRYQLNAEEIPYISGSNAIKVTLNDSTKQVISMKFTVNTLTDVNGAASTPWLRVDTATRYDANYVVIDENGNACKTIEAGKTYTLFLTSPENVRSNSYGQPANTTEFVVYLVGKDSQSVADITFTEIASHAVSGVSVEGGSLTYQTKTHHGNAGYYLYDGKWNLSYASYYSAYRQSPTATNNSAETREFFLTVNGENIEQMQFKFRWVEGSANGTPNYDIFFSGYTTTFYKNGVAVAVADRKAGEWYDVVVKKDGYVSGTITVYGLGYNNSYPIDFQYQIADVEYMLGDPSPVSITSTETYWVTLTRTGTSRYTFITTNKLSNGASAAAWQRSFTLKNPLSTAAVLKMDFTFDYAYDAEGNEIDSNLFANGLNYAIVEKNTGKLVGRCETGKEYTMFINVDAGATAKVYMGQGDGNGINAGITITNREALETPAAGVVTMTPNSKDYGVIAQYQVDGEWRYGFTTYTGIQSTGASGHYYRRVYLKQAASTYDMLTFEFKYDVAQKVTADGTVTQVTDDLMISGAKYYTMDGVQVTNRTFTVGQWYKVVVTSATTLGESLDVFPLREQNRADTHELEITIAFRNFVALEKDTNPVVVEYNNTYNSNNAKNTVGIVDGKHVYTYTTRDVAIPTNSPYGRRLNISVPADITYLSIEFRFTEAYKADGITEFAPSLGVYLNASSGLGSPRIYDANGKLVASGNAATGLVIDEWYTVIINPGGATSFGLWPAHNYKDDAAILTMEIRDRSTHTVGESLATFSTPAGNFPEPNVTYYNGQWVQVISGNSATSATQENKRLAVTMANAGAGKLRFEMMMQNASGTAIPHMYGASGLKIYNMDGTALASNNTALDSGVWYIFEYETGANLGTSIIYLGYMGGGGKVGGLDAFIRNVQITEIGQVTINFNLGYDGAESITPATVEQGAAYGTLPTPADREGYTFAGWYTNAACTGSAVTKDTTVSASHTLYAKWEIVPDTNPVVVGSVTNGTKTVDYVDGKHVYTYSTSGVGGTLNKKVNITFPEGSTYVAVEFCITESKTAAGADLAPYLRIYDQNNGGNGGTYINTIWIYDVNGNQVTNNNTPTSLTVGQWYTLVVKMKTGTQFNMMPLSAYADAFALTMKIRDRVIDNSGVAVESSTTNGIQTVKLENNKLVYGFTTRGVANPGAGATARKQNISFAEGLTSVAINFRFTEALDANGAEFKPSLGVYYNGSGTGSAQVKSATIYDSKGNFVVNGNTPTGLTVGEWYTVIVEVGSTWFSLCPAHNYSAGVPTLTMEIRDCSTYIATTSNASITANSGEAGWGTYYPAANGAYVYATKPHAASNSSAAWQRTFNITNNLDTAAIMQLDFKYITCTDGSGNPITNPGTMAYVDSSTPSGYVVMDKETGKLVGTCEVGKWYTIFMEAEAGATKRIHIGAGYSGTSNIHMIFANWDAVEAPTAGDVTLGHNSLFYGNLSRYYVDGEWRYGYTSFANKLQSFAGGATPQDVDYRHVKVKQAAGTYNEVSFEFRFDVGEKIDAEGTKVEAANLAFSGATAKYYDENGAQVTTLAVGNWYKVVLTPSGTTFNASFTMYPMGYYLTPRDGSQTNMTIAFRNLQAKAAS